MKATFDSPCYFAYLSGCNDIKEGDEIHHEGFRMSWHPECDPETNWANQPDDVSVKHPEISTKHDVCFKEISPCFRRNKRLS